MCAHMHVFICNICTESIRTFMYVCMNLFVYVCVSVYACTYLHRWCLLQPVCHNLVSPLQANNSSLTCVHLPFYLTRSRDDIGMLNARRKASNSGQRMGNETFSALGLLFLMNGGCFFLYTRSNDGKMDLDELIVLERLGESLLSTYRCLVARYHLDRSQTVLLHASN